METRALLITLAIVTGLFGASSARYRYVENIESSRPVKLPIRFWSKLLASPHIVGGHEAIPHSHPHQVILFIEIATHLGERARTTCGGSLLSNLWVVTAAHCIDKAVLFENPRAVYSDRYKLAVTVGIGTHDLSEIEFGNATNVQLVNASKIIIHPEWNPTRFVNDIALLKLDESVVLDGKYSKIIRLPKISKKMEEFKDSTVTFTGWGLAKLNPMETPKKIQTADTKVVDHYDCRLKYDFRYIRETNICTSCSNGQSLCQGDSGGPLIVKEADGKPTLIGIASFIGYGCESGLPNVFTRVTSYIDWIHEITNIPLRN